MLYTTLNKLKAVEGWDEDFGKLTKALYDRGNCREGSRDDLPVRLTDILEICGVDAAVVWGVTSCGEEAIDFARRFALLCARHVEDLIDSPTVKKCNEMCDRFLDGSATRRELMDACFGLDTFGDARIDDFVNSASGLVEMALLSVTTEKILGAAALAVRDCYYAAQMVEKGPEELEWIGETFRKMLEKD